MTELQVDPRRTISGRVDLKLGADAETGAGASISVENPATQEVIAEVRAASPEQVERAVQIGLKAFGASSLGTAEERGAALHRLATLMDERADLIVATIVSEVGTPVNIARALHVDVPISTLRWFGDNAGLDRTERLGVSDGPPRNEAIVLHRPVGVVASITAYNYPLMFAAAKFGAAFAAGCPTVLLPSPQSPLSTLLFADLVEEAGFPDGALSVLVGGVDVAQALIGSAGVSKVSFTGSVPAGTAVMQAAAVGVRDVVLELGGKSAAILLPDADVSAVAAPVHQRYLRNAGQGCASPTRVLVHASRFDEFIEASRAVYGDVAIGDPWDPKTLVGPVISEQHRDRVRGFVDDAVAHGGSVVAETPLPGLDRGWWNTPTLIGDLPNSARINREEVFGPVASVQRYETIDEAVAIANDSEFGLHASVFGPHDEAFAVAPQLQAGHVTLNGGGPLRTDAPTGGWKASGIGREYGEHGIREFLEPVTVQWPVG